MNGTNATRDTATRETAPREPGTLKIDVKQFGPGRPTFVIAEIGVNHDGSANKALELVRIAANCGADAVKLQIFRATSLVHPSCKTAEYQKKLAPFDNAVDQ